MEDSKFSSVSTEGNEQAPRDIKNRRQKVQDTCTGRVLCMKCFHYEQWDRNPVGYAWMQGQCYKMPVEKQ